MKLLPCCILVLCCALLAGSAAGYTIAFTVVPAETTAGETVAITGTSSIPAGYTDEAILYREVPNYPSKEVGRYSFTTTEGGAWGFSIDTTGFTPATYKVQLPKSGVYPYGSSAVLMQTFTLTAPPETPTPVTPADTPLQTPVSTPVETTAPPESPTPTATPVGTLIAVAALGICAGGCAYARRTRDG